MKKLLYTPNIDVLAEILNGRREALRAYGRAGAAERWRRFRNRPCKPKEKGQKAVRRLALPGPDMLLSRMASGQWYTMGELRALMPEYAAGSVKAWVTQQRQAGALDRALNADYDGAWGVEPRHLYRLKETPPSGRGFLV